MRRIKMSGASFRRALLTDEGFSQKAIGLYTGINGRNISETLRGIGQYNEKFRRMIYDYYSEKVLKPISFIDFWTKGKEFAEIDK